MAASPSSSKPPPGRIYVALTGVDPYCLRVGDTPLHDLSLVRHIALSSIEQFTCYHRSEIVVHRILVFNDTNVRVVVCEPKSRPSTTVSASQSTESVSIVADSPGVTSALAEQATPDSPIVLADDGWTVKLAVLPTLLSYLIFHYDTDQRRVFFHYLRNMSTCNQVVSALISLHSEIVASVLFCDSQDKLTETSWSTLHVRNVLVPAQLSMIGRFLYEWAVECDGVDFLDDGFWRVDLSPFLQEHFPHLYKLLCSSLKLRPRHETLKPFQFSFVARAQKFDFDAFSVDDVVHSIIHIDSCLFAAIEWSEFLDECWTKPAKQFRCPNLMRSIKTFNKISVFIQAAILFASNLSSRVARWSKAIAIANGLFQGRDYAGTLAVLAGLDSAPVYRLKETAQYLDRGFVEMAERIQSKVSPDGNYRQVRQLVKDAIQQRQSCVPYTGVYLRDLVFAGDGQPTMVGDKINFAKFISLDRIVREMQQLQRIRPHGLRFHEDIVAHVLDSQQLDEATLFRRSEEIQPRKASQAAKKK